MAIGKTITSLYDEVRLDFERFRRGKNRQAMGASYNARKTENGGIPGEGVSAAVRSLAYDLAD